MHAKVWLRRGKAIYLVALRQIKGVKMEGILSKLQLSYKSFPCAASEHL